MDKQPRRTSQPRLLHPLMGSNPRTLLRLIVQNGPGNYPLHLFIILSAAFLRWPFSTYERWQVSRTDPASIGKLSTDRPLAGSPSTGRLSTLQKPPIFIVGHWRSGTTFLYNVLSRSPQFAYVSPLSTGLPWDFLTLGNLLRPILEKALPEGRFIDKVPVEPDSPQEDEIALASMQTLSFYHGLYFPKRFVQHFNAGIFFEGCHPSEIARWEQAIAHFYKKLQLQSPQQQLLIKNPVYTARIRQLRKLWPTAKFIHIYRNPYIVFQSTLNFYRKLFPEIALQPFDQVPIREIVLKSYPKMMTALLQDSQQLPPQDFVTLQFETFEANPIEQLQRIYRQLELEGWKSAEPAFQQYLNAQKTYQKNRYSFSEESIYQVTTHWRPFIERWGYKPPAEATNEASGKR
ncbi:MAG: sulfotransferase [Cyanobacteria bacterium J06623_5]